MEQHSPNAGQALSLVDDSVGRKEARSKEGNLAMGSCYQNATARDLTSFSFPPTGLHRTVRDCILASLFCSNSSYCAPGAMASTSRLKRKAEYDPDLLAGNNLAESFVSFGTALPSLASTKKDQGEYVPVWKQVRITCLLVTLLF